MAWGLRTVWGPSVQNALIALMTENIDASRSLTRASGLEGLLTCPRWHAVLALRARQRAGEWNFNEVQYALPPGVIFPCDFKSGCLWMLSLELTAVQRAQVLKTASDLCVMARRDRNSVLSPIPPYDFSSNLPAGRRMMDRQTHPSIFVTLLW